MRHRPALLLLAAALLGSACGELLFVQVEVAEICKTFEGQTVPGVPTDVEGAFAFDEELPLGEVLSQVDEDLATLDARLVGMSFLARSGIEDFAFADELSVDVETSDGALPALALVRYTREASAAAPKQLELEVAPNDLTPYLRAPAVKLKTALRGALPRHDWQMDVRACLSAKGHVRYLKALESMPPL